jgi:hypothetical protein
LRGVAWQALVRTNNCFTGRKPFDQRLPKVVCHAPAASTAHRTRCVI